MGTMVAIAFISVLGVVLAQFSSSVSEIFISVERTTVINDSFEIVRKTLSSGRACSANLGGKGIQLNAQVTVPIRRFNSATNQLVGDPLIVLNQQLRGVTVRDMTLIHRTDTADALAIADLNITYEIMTKNSANPAMRKLVVRSLPMHVVLQGGQVQECWQKEDQGNLIYKQVCLALSKGALDSVDGDGNCILAGGKWIKGNYQKATCPENGFLPSDASRLDNCRVTMPANFTDPFPLETVALSDGTTTTMGRQPYLINLDKAGQSCLCDWAADLSLSSYSGATCEIYCVVPE